MNIKRVQTLQTLKKSGKMFDSILLRSTVIIRTMFIFKNSVDFVIQSTLFNVIIVNVIERNKARSFPLNLM